MSGLVRLGLVWWLWGCAAAPVVPEQPGVYHRETQARRYTVDVRFEPAQPKLGELFKVRAEVKEKGGAVLERGQVTLDARMPQHGHGMETKPVQDPGTCAGDDCVHPGGVYVTEGFKFHMPGSWTVTVDVTGPGGPDSTSFVFEMP